MITLLQTSSSSDVSHNVVRVPVRDDSFYIINAFDLSAYKTHFFTQIFALNKGVRLIHKARNLGCFTSSAQATQTSQIDDQPLPQPVSELRLGYDFISFVFLTYLARL